MKPGKFYFYLLDNVHAFCMGSVVEVLAIHKQYTQLKIVYIFVDCVNLLFLLCICQMGLIQYFDNGRVPIGFVRTLTNMKRYLMFFISINIKFNFIEYLSSRLLPISMKFRHILWICSTKASQSTSLFCHPPLAQCTHIYFVPHFDFI